ncbi:hypothetical protein AEGHOMDF_2519 [Methylobacterium soli]|nr:hypothetical protein AEGHOMDF_2519 [Methylobacterium soli]
MGRARDEQRTAGGLLLLGQRVGRDAAHLGLGIFQRVDQSLDHVGPIMLVERLRGRGPHRGVVVGETLEQQHPGFRADRLGQRHHRHAADAGIRIGAALGQIVEIVVEGVEHGHGAHRNR